MAYYKTKILTGTFKIAMVLLLVSFCSLVYSRTQELRDENPQIRRSAAWALVEIEKPTVESLVTALKDEDSGGQRWAARALRWITGETFGENPAKWQEWWKKNKER